MDMKHKMMGIRIFAFAACVLFASSCLEESFETRISEGEPVMAQLTVSVPASEKVIATRAGSSHSEIAALDIFVYNQGTGAFESTSKAVLDGGSLDGTTRRYTVSFSATTGNKTLLAIANGHDQSDWATDMETLAAKKLSLDDMKKEVIRLQQSLIDASQLPGFSALRMLLIGQENVSITKNDATGEGRISGNPLALHRAAVEVTFEITNGSVIDTDGSGILEMDFNPSVYKVYNVPQGTRIGSGDITPVDIGYFDSGAMVVPPKNNDMYSFTFYMPENIREKGTNTDYNGREAWDNGSKDTATPAGEKVWSNAPENSTFVVITGAFNAVEKTNLTDETGVLKETGEVSYTIHLGNFGADIADYSVERNYSYKYKVTVNGVNNIIAEAERRDEDKWQNAAEGGVITVGKYTQDYTLDAHYEQVFLEYNISDMAVGLAGTDDEIKSAIGEKLMMIVETPYTKSGNEYTKPYKEYVVGLANGEAEADIKARVVDEMDYKWVEFYPQTETGQLATYPGKVGLGDPGETIQIDGYDLTVALGKAIFDCAKGQLSAGNRDVINITTNADGDYVARFTAFVDEFYYAYEPLSDVAQPANWADFVNTDMRRMLLAMDVKGSEDHNSQSVQLYSNISQRSMQTFYDLQKAGELYGFGIEAFNETPGTRIFGSPVKNGDSMGNGYYNTLLMIGGSGQENGLNYAISGRVWDSYVNWPLNGYLSGNVSTDPILSHKIPDSQPAGEDVQAYRACMSRNRDLNGNGSIDLDEVRWYMPSVHEYIRIALGSGAIASESQLYHGQKSDLIAVGYPGANAKDASLYYTSTSGSARMYYAVEKGSYGEDWGSSAEYGPSAVRCIRHLPDNLGIGVTIPDAFYTLKKLPDSDSTDDIDDGNYLLDYTGILQSDLLRQTPMEGGYREHHDDENQINRFPKGMVVSTDYIRDDNGYVRLFTFDDVTTGTDVCEQYYSEKGADDLGDWRVPNQVELTSMTSRSDVLFRNVPLLTIHPLYPGEREQPIFGATGHMTSFYLWGALSRTKFSRQDVRYGFAFRGDLISCSNPAYVGSIRGGVRCVRDATENERLTATEVNE